MPRPEKVQAVAEIKERLAGARAVFLAEYAGLSVKEQQELRRELRIQGADFRIVKMTLARRAADELDIGVIDELLVGPTGLAFADADPVGAAKVLQDFARDHGVFKIKGGLLGRELLGPERVAALAAIEPREVLLARLAGALQAPMAKMAALLAALPRNTAAAIQQLLEKKEAGAVPPASAPAEAEGETTEAEPAPDETSETEVSTEVTTDEPEAGSEAQADDEAPEEEE